MFEEVREKHAYCARFLYVFSPLDSFLSRVRCLKTSEYNSGKRKSNTDHSALRLSLDAVLHISRIVCQ